MIAGIIESHRQFWSTTQNEIFYPLLVIKANYPVLLKFPLWTSLALLCGLVLTGCSIPKPPQQSVATNISNEQVQAHQARLQRINRWQLSGRFALTDLSSNNKDSAYLRWQSSPQQQAIIITHPLRGELAELIITPTAATIKVDGEQVQSLSAQGLLYRYTGMQLPVDELPHWLLGRLDPRLSDFNFDTRGRLIKAVYQTRDGERWQLTWFYQAQQLLPEQVHAETPKLKLKIQAQRWQTQPATNHTDH